MKGWLKMVHSIGKGKDFERLIATLLTRKTGVKWMRVPQSGGFASVNDSEDSRFQGDVFTEDKQFEDFVVECKITGSNLLLNDLFREKSLLEDWWKQTVEESESKTPVLFFKYKFSPVFLMTQSWEFARKIVGEQAQPIDLYSRMIFKVD